MQNFKASLIITIICLSIAYYWGNTTGALVALILGVLEVSLSFDNAIVNASVLKRMDEKWQQYFLTWGVLVAVFGMRLIFPIAIVTFATGVDFLSVSEMAMHEPQIYAKHLADAHVQIAAFGGMFLLMVFFSFIFDDEKELHWLGYFEEKMSLCGKLESIEIIFSVFILLGLQNFLNQEVR